MASPRHVYNGFPGVEGARRDAGGGRFPRGKTDASVQLFQVCFSFSNVELRKAGSWPQAAVRVSRRGSSTSFNLFGSDSPKLASAWLWPASARPVRGRRPRLQGSLFQYRGAGSADLYCGTQEGWNGRLGLTDGDRALRGAATSVRCGCLHATTARLGCCAYFLAFRRFSRELLGLGRGKRVWRDFAFLMPFYWSFIAFLMLSTASLWRVGSG
jgi:hypothetical protein